MVNDEIRDNKMMTIRENQAYHLSVEQLTEVKKPCDTFQEFRLFCSGDCCYLAALFVLIVHGMFTITIRRLHPRLR
jgi:hypothetical protein